MNDVESVEGPGGDLVWDSPARPSGAALLEWQGIARVSLALASDGAASLRLEPLTGTLRRSDYEVRVSGPRVKTFTLVEAPPALVLNFGEHGGRGTYFVTLSLSRDSAPAALPVHPFFATAPFSFSVDCESGDCRPSAASAPAAVSDAAPSVDLLTKDYDGFVQLLVDRIRVQNPDWTDFSPASLERVLVEMLAHHGDLLSYYQDRVGNEAFLDTATQRFSVRQHGRLLGYELSEAEAATTLLSFSVNQAVTLPERFAVRAPRRVDEAPVIFSVASDTRLSEERNAEHLRAAQWPDAFSARVAVGATAMLVLGHVSALEVGDRVAFVRPGAPSQIRTLARVEQLSLPGWVSTPHAPLTTLPRAVTRIHWQDGLSSELPVWSTDASPESSPLEIHANLVDARHGLWLRARLSASPTELDDEEPEIPLTAQCAVIAAPPAGVVALGADGSRQLWHLRALRLPEGPVLHDRLGDELAVAVEVTLNDEVWLRQPDLQRSQPFDRHFVADADNDGRVWLRFGDGRQGRSIPLSVAADQRIESARLTGADVLALRYRVGAPLAGNVDAGKLNEIVPGQVFDDFELAAIDAVTNVTAGTGGTQSETLDAARLAIPASLRRGVWRRAVTLEDHARIAELADVRVARATARNLGGPFGTVLVLVDPADRAALDAELQAVVARALERARMVGREVLVRGADVVPLDVQLAVCAREGHARDQVKQAVLAALRPGSPQRPGFFHPNRLSFGQDVELGDVLAEVHRVPGVLGVKATVFQRLRAAEPRVVPRIELGITEIARLDADPTHPESGRLVVEVVGLDDVDPGIFQLASSGAARGEAAA